MRMESWGFGPIFEEAFRPFEVEGRIPGRVVRAAGRQVYLVTPWGEMEGVGSGEAVVGDWVALDPATGRVVAVLPRRTVLSRRRPGRGSAEQVLAGNVDVAFVVTALDGDFSVRRIERYLTLAASGGVDAVVVLSKADVAEEREARRSEVERVAGGRPVIVVSAVSGEGVERVRAELGVGRTAVLLGSSGAGKSTLLNALAGEERARTSGVAGDGRGRHTTTHRELFELPDGGLVVDVPGLREVGVVGTEEDVASAFAEVVAAGARCRFRDCRHEGEPGCAVAEAVERGEVDEDRVEAFHALRREAAAHARRADTHAQRDHERRTIGRWRKEHRAQRKGRSR